MLPEGIFEQKKKVWLFFRILFVYIRFDRMSVTTAGSRLPLVHALTGRAKGDRPNGVRLRLCFWFILIRYKPFFTLRFCMNVTQCYEIHNSPSITSSPSHSREKDPVNSSHIPSHTHSL